MRRKLGLALLFGAALPLAVASIAWACGVLATLKVDPSDRVAAPGEAITATGKNYGVSGFGPVTIRLKGRNGRVLTTTTPLPDGRITAEFPLPDDLDPGWYVLVATQNRLSDGAPKSGTPGRTSIRVQGSGRQAAAVSPWGGASSGPGSADRAAAAGDGRSLLPLLLAVALSLSMLGSGFALLRRRATPGPQFGV